MKLNSDTSVHTRVPLDGEENIASFLVVPSEIPPLPSKDRGVLVCMTIMHHAAASGKERVLHKALKAFVEAVQSGRNYIAKADCKHWEKIVNAGYARQSTNHIHFINFKGTNDKKNLVKVTLAMLDLSPMDMLHLIVVAYYLRMSDLPGTKRASREAAVRLRGNRHRGGICLTEVASLFNKTKQWASYMRKRMVKAGLMIFTARYMQAPLAKYLHEFIEHREKFLVWAKGQVVRRLTSECTILESVCFRRVCLRQDAYAAAKGR